MTSAWLLQFQGSLNRLVVYTINQNTITRQMMVIAGGEPELCCRRHAKREGGVYACRVCITCALVLSRMQCACVVLMYRKV